MGHNKSKKAQQITSGFTQAGAQLVRHCVSNSCFRLSSEPLRCPRLREAATTLHASGRHAPRRDFRRTLARLDLKVLYNLTDNEARQRYKNDES